MIVQGDKVTKEYDPAMHTAEHILNAVMTRRYGTRSFSTHIEKKKSKCDYRINISPSDDDILSVEYEINSVTREKHPVKENFIARSDAANSFDLDKLPDSAGDSIRIILIGSIDKYPCIGGHVSNTSEIGVFKIYSHDFSEGVLRLRFRLE